ncbi:MAG: helix-turn-helix domain-containing protein [Muribaculaceae bacterium]|nr:helix-turn-helix domain-containing protein [Muribaculaceae bacterium]
MIDIQTIVHLYRNGDYSCLGIARKLGISRTTVDKVLAQYEATQETSDNEALDNLLTLQPAYNSQGGKPRRLSDAIAAEIQVQQRLHRHKRHPCRLYELRQRSGEDTRHHRPV